MVYMMMYKEGQTSDADSSLDAPCKVFERKSFHIRSIKHRLITKIITELVCKLRDESNEPN